MKKTEKMIHQNIRFRSRIDTFLVSIEEFPSPSENAYEVQQGPNKEYCHDFALILLKEPIRVEWRRTGINS